MIRKSILVVCLGLVATAPLFAANKEQKRLENAGVVMQEMMNTPENIPQEVMEKADCVIVFPSVAQGGVRSRRKLRPRRDGLPDREEFQGTVGRSGHVWRSKAAALDFKSAGKPPISFCWS